MPIFTIEPRKRYNTTLAEYQTSLGRSALETGALAFRESPMTASMNALRLAELNAPPTPPDREITPEEIIAGVEEPVVPEKKLIPAEEARERVKSLNLKLDIPDEGMYEPALDFLIELKQQENLSRSIVERGPTGFWAGATRFTAALGGSMLDPVNIGAAFVPVVGQARYANMMSKATTAAQRAGVRARVGAVEGLAGATLVEPLSYFPLQYTQADYTMTDSLLNIGLGTVLGSGLHVAGGGSADFYRNWRNRPDPFVRFKDLSVDEIKQVQEVDTVLQRGIQTPEELGIILRNYPPRVLRAAGLIKDPAPDISAEEVAAPAGSIFGEDTQLTIGQAKVPAQWAVVDLVDVEATMSKADNQWRDRTRQASAAQIREIANAPDYDQLQWSPIMDFGAPTISVDGLVIGGNGRIMGISDAYDRGTAANYRSRMLAELENYGIDPTAIQNMRKPMMVRILKNRVDVKKAAIISNEGGSARMSALEQAAVDSERLGDFRRFDVPETGDMNIASNREAIRQWVSQFPTNQRPALLTAEGYLSKEGVMRLRNAILYRAYGDSPVLKRLVESTDPESANVSTALVRAAGPIADARDRIKAGDLYDLDLSDDIQAAASKLSELRKKGQRYEDWIAQQDMLGIGMTDVQLRLLEFLDNNIRSARAMSSLLTKYYEALDAAGDPKQADIFGDVAPPTKDDLLQQALNDFENDPSAAARVSKVSPETRELALRTAVGQFADGRDINIDPILNADPSIDTTTPESLRAAAQAEQSPESIATADFDASAKADATKPMDEVDVALDDAVQRAEEAVERGNEAYKYSRDQESIEPRQTLADGDPLLTETIEINTPERIQFRESFAEDLTKDGVVVQGRKPIAYVMGGGGGSGKTRLLELLVKKGAVPEKGTVKISPDDIKEVIPEYNQILDAGDSRAAEIVHEESSYISKLAQAKAIEKNMDIILDVTLGNKDSGVAKLQQLKDSGYEIRLIGVTTDIMTAVERAILRGINTGRFVKADALIGSHKGFSLAWPEYAKIADNSVLYDNSVEPTLIAQSAQGKLEISSEKLYNNFVEKGNIDETANIFSQLRNASTQIADRQSAQAQARRILGLPEETRTQEQKIADLGRLSGQRLSVEEITTIVRQSFGRATDDLLKAGKIEIVETPADLPPNPNGVPHPDDVRGMYFRGKTYIVARNAQPERLKGTVLHEIGEHAGMEKMLGKELYDELQESFYQGMLRGDKAFLDAAARVPQDTDLRDVASEQLAYLVQNAPELPIVKRVIAAVRAWLWRTFKLARDRIELSEADIRALAVSSLHAAARRARNARRMEIEDGIVSPRMARGSFENSVFNRLSGKPKTREELAEWYMQPLKYHGRPPKQLADPSYPQVKGHMTALGMEYERLYSNYYKRAYGKYRKDGMDDLDAQTAARKDLDAYKQRVRTGQYDPLKRTKFGKERPVSEAGDRIMYSRDADYPTDLALELKVADEAVMRAEEYARAVRSVAERLENEGQAREIIRSQGVFSEQEIDDILKELRRKNTQVRARLRKVRAVATAEDRAAGMQSEAMQAANELADEMVRAAKVEKRNAALNLMVEKKGLSFIFSEFKGMEGEGFKALLAGSQMRRAGARDSVQAQQDSALGDFLGGIIADMESQNLWKLFISETMARETADALFRLDMPEAKMDGLPKEAIKIAEIIHKYQESARSLENRHGAWVGKVAGYVMRQSHDPFRIRKVSYAEWRDFVLPLLDMEKTFGVRGVTNIEASLSTMYDNFASGLHRQFDPDEALQIAFRGQGRSIARKVSESRVLYFKDGKAAFDYNERFGTAKFTDAVLGGLESSARAIGLMKKLGTNPQMMIMRLMDTVEENLRSDPISKAKFHEQRQSILDLLAILDGSANIPGNQLAARIGANTRVWQSVSKLGGAVVSSFADIPVYAAEAKFQGRGFLSGMADAIGGLLQGRGSAEQKAIMNDLGVFFESMRNGVIRRFDTETNLGGAMTSLQTKFFKWNGLSWWTEVLQKSSALSMSADLAAMRNLSFDKIRPEMQNILSLYNIDAGKWDLIRQGVIREVDGRAYMTPEGFINIPRPALENYLNSIGRQVNDASVENLVSDLQASFRAMFVDRAEHAVIETDARTRQFLLRGTKPGTVWGETARFIAQFKSFPVALWQRALGREVYGKGYNSVADFLKNGKGDRLGLVNLILWMTLFGYAAMSAKDILRGKSPRDPNSPSTWLAAMLQGGAFGIYGDFLFGEMKNRFGGGFLATLAGPTFGTVEDIADIYGRLRSGEDAAAATFRTTVANTPFANLFYARIALDYLILYRIQEWMNPGYLRRMERRIERENAQQFLIRPSEAVR